MLRSDRRTNKPLKDSIKSEEPLLSTATALATLARLFKHVGALRELYIQVHDCNTGCSISLKLPLSPDDVEKAYEVISAARAEPDYDNQFDLSEVDAQSKAWRCRTALRTLA